MSTHCLKITQNVSYEFFNFGIFHQFLSCLVTLFDSKLHVFKNSLKLTIFGILNKLLSTQNVNVASLAMLNETFSVIFKQRDKICVYRFECFSQLQPWKS